MNKKCCKCKQTLEIVENFSKNKSSKDGYAKTCKKCHNDYCKADYEKNSDIYKDRAKKNQKIKVEHVKSLREDLECSRCGEDHPATLDFHHFDPNQKDISVSLAVYLNWSIEHIEKEISKCVVLCSNCHRKEHYLLRNGVIGNTSVSETEDSRIVP